MLRLTKLSSAAIPALVLLMWASTTSAQMIVATDSGLGGPNKVSGTVLSPSGERIATHIPIKLVTEARGNRVATVDEFGNFAFSGLTNGDYSILIDKEPDYETSNTPFTINQMRGAPGQSILLNIRLNYKKGVSHPPAVINASLARVPKPALDLYNQGVDKGKLGDAKGAIQLFEEAIKAFADFPDAYNDMGTQYLKLRDLEKADAAFQAALNIDPTAYGPTMNRGMTLFFLKRFTDAVPVLRAALKMKSDQAGPHYFLGQSLAYLGTFDEAESELNAAVGIAPQQAVEGYRLLAIIHSSKGKKKEAADDLDKYLKLNPTTPDADNLKEAIKKFKSGN
jgi:tetratricopeptide (TPR) repeat protein